MIDNAINKRYFFICLPLLFGDISCSPYSDKGIPFLSAESMSFILLDVLDSKKLTMKCFRYTFLPSSVRGLQERQSEHHCPKINRRKLRKMDQNGCELETPNYNSSPSMCGLWQRPIETLRKRSARADSGRRLRTQIKIWHCPKVPSIDGGSTKY